MRLRPGLDHPGPRWGSLHSPDPQSGFKGTLCGGEGRRKEAREGREREREERRREGGEGVEGRLTLMRSWNRAADWLRPVDTGPECIFNRNMQPREIEG